MIYISFSAFDYLLEIILSIFIILIFIGIPTLYIWVNFKEIKTKKFKMLLSLSFIIFFIYIYLSGLSNSVFFKDMVTEEVYISEHYSKLDSSRRNTHTDYYIVTDKGDTFSLDESFLDYVIYHGYGYYEISHLNNENETNFIQSIYKIEK